MAIPRYLTRTLLIVAVLAVVSVFAQQHIAAQRYFPVLKISSPDDGLTFHVIQDAVQERRACGEANDRMLNPVKSSCKQCAVVYARCERELQDDEAALVANGPTPYYQVATTAVRLTIYGPDAAARAACEQIAGGMIKAGLKTAVCVSPKRK